ncbi:MAG: DUF4912 domain-containing protein [Deferribacteraceae bacterium]|jgi:hypothetical protein|nr:DUF4912 domain-containing protein [Deferribacteraceae bacterium]
MATESKYDKMTKSELMVIAKELNIAGRSTMNKEQLLTSIKANAKETSPVMKKSGVKSVDKVAQKQADAPGYEMKRVTPKVSEIPDYPIPTHYNQDMIFMFAVEPDGEYVYWEVSESTQQRLKKEYGISECRFDLRLYTEDGGVHQLAGQAVGSRGDWYFRIWAPMKKLWAEVGVWDNAGRYHRVLSSAIVIMPSNIVSDNVDVNWMTVTDKWERIYTLSGMEDETFVNTDSSVQKFILHKLKDHLSSKTRMEGGI